MPVLGTVPVLRSGMKNAASRPGHESAAEPGPYRTRGLVWSRLCGAASRTPHRVRDTMHHLLRRPGEQQQVAVGVLDDEISRAPRLLLERLKERHAHGLKLKKEVLDFLRGRDGERRQQ